MKRTYLNLRDGPPKRFLAYMVVPLLLMSSLSVNAERPHANFSVEPSDGKVPFTIQLDATGSYDTDSDDITSYRWSLDGTLVQKNEPKIDLTITDPGSHDIGLIVYDGTGAQDEVHRTVFGLQEEAPQTAVIPPPVNLKITATPETGPKPLSLTLDASTSASAGEIKTYNWTVSDGNDVQTASETTASLTLEGDGPYTVTLAVTTNNDQVITVEYPNLVKPSINNPSSGGNNQGNGTSTEPDNTATGTPDEEPQNKTLVAEFIWVKGTDPFTVNVDASESSGNIVKYEWHLDNNEKAGEGEKTTLSLPGVGTHSVTLTVTDDNGKQAKNAHDITVEASTPEPEIPPQLPANQPPVAEFTVGEVVSNPEGTFTVVLDASGSSDPDGNPITYNWNPAGNNISGSQTTLSFLEAGTYPVTLTVTDDKGLTDSEVKEIIIEQPLSASLNYNTTARTTPQIIAAGVSPSQVDFPDSGFNIVALVRPGMSFIHTVSFQDTTGQILNVGMQRVGVLSNGDEIYQLPFSLPGGPGSMGTTTFSTAWGSKDGQYNIIAKGKNNMPSQTYPYLKIGNYPSIDNVSSRREASPLSYNKTKRFGPQIIMAGYSPAILHKLDDQFDVIAIVRPGALSISQVLLKDGSGQFHKGMELAGELDNGDKVYKSTYIFEVGALGSPDTGFIDHKDLWGLGTEQFSIEVKDEGGQKSHKFPNIEFGDYPEHKP